MLRYDARVFYFQKYNLFYDCNYRFTEICPESVPAFFMFIYNQNNIFTFSNKIQRHKWMLHVCIYLLKIRMVKAISICLKIDMITNRPILLVE